MDAKAYKVSEYTAESLKYFVRQGDNISHTETLEFAQKIAAALNFFDTVMAALSADSNYVTKAVQEPKYIDYAVGGSWIATIGFAKNEQRLRVKKYDGTVITHFGVPETLFRQLVNSKSVGQAYNSLIRGKYEQVTKKPEIVNL